MDNFALNVAEIYDLIYSHKDYSGELNYLLSRVNLYEPHGKKILELGCGTGNYSKFFLEMGFKYSGVDLSESMVSIARQRYGDHFTVADASNYRSIEPVDNIFALFHVFNYFKTEQQRQSFFKNAYDNLVIDGMLVFDFWHGPAVYHDTPKTKKFCLENQYLKIIRFTEPVVDITRNIINVHFDFHCWRLQDNYYSQFHEVHDMKLLFIDEIIRFSDMYKFEVLAIEKWLKPKQELTIDDWYGLVVLRKK